MRRPTLKIFGNLFDDVTVAIDGKDALAKFLQDKQAYDFIFSDINMPNMNGITLLEEIRKVDEHIPFIIISAHNEVEYKIQSDKYGANGYLYKPIDLQLFIQVIMKVVTTIQNECAYRV